MRMPRTPYLLGAAALALLGAGVARAATAQLHTMQVNAPDGSVVHVRYAGDVAPRVEIVPADAATPADLADADLADAAFDPFARMERISAMMDAQMQAMMQRAALVDQQAARMQQQAAAPGGTPGLTMTGDMPQGMHVTYYSSSTDANGCTRSVSYASDGTQAAPRVTQAASDGCEAASPDTRAIPASAQVPVAQPQAPGRKV